MKQITLLFLSLAVLPSAAQSESRDSLALRADSLMLRDSLAVSDSLLLHEVTVTAQRPLVKQEADRISYDVKNDEESKTTTVIEMLKKVPYVTVDGQNNITVKGSSNFKIYKNGRPNKSFSGNAKDILAAIPASSVKRIEVITEPGAKYDAEGLDGILNIVMDGDMRLAGFVGNARAGLAMNGNHHASLWGTVQTGRLTLSPSYGIQRQSGSSSTSHNDHLLNYTTSGNTYRYHNDHRNPGFAQWGGVEASYELDTLNLLTASVNAWSYNVRLENEVMASLTDPAGLTLYSFGRHSLNHSRQSYVDMDGHVDYQHLTHRKGEALNVSYLISTTRTHTRSVTAYTDIVNQPAYSRMDELNRNHFTEHTLQLDWTRPTWENQTLETGAKYILRRNNSNASQDNDEQRVMTSAFRHTTQVAALYAQYRLKTGRLSLIGGLRYEYSRLSARFKDGTGSDFARQLNDWVPSLTASWRITDAHTLKLNYAMRINRPGISYLNPAVFRSPAEVTQGNPDLESSNQHNVTLTYSMTTPKLTLTAGPYLKVSANQLLTTKTVLDDVVYTGYANVGHYRDYGMTLYAQWKPLKQTTWMVNGRASQTRYENPPQALTNHRFTYSLYSQLTQKLPWKLQLQLAGGHNAGGVGQYSYMAGMWYYSFGLQRAFLKDDRMTVRLFAWNPVHYKWESYKTYYTRGDYTGVMLARYHATYYSLTVSVRIGSLNASVKKTNKTVSNDDLQGRK